jgi:hypothetical protein
MIVKIKKHHILDIIENFKSMEPNKCIHSENFIKIFI